jgi:hypothetical protein
VVSHIKSRKTHTLFSSIEVSGCKYRNLYQRVLTTTTLTINTQTSHGLQLSICARFGRGSLFFTDNRIDEENFTIWEEIFTTPLFLDIF